MKHPIPILAACLLLSLSACMSVPEFSGYDMTLDSDDCRAASILKADAPATQNRTAGERQADFDRVYHACMVAKGY